MTEWLLQRLVRRSFTSSIRHRTTDVRNSSSGQIKYSKKKIIILYERIYVLYILYHRIRTRCNKNHVRVSVCICGEFIYRLDPFCTRYIHVCVCTYIHLYIRVCVCV